MGIKKKWHHSHDIELHYHRWHDWKHMADALSDRGMEMTTPFPVPTHRRLQETIRAVILTKEKPSLPVPVTHTASVIWTALQDSRFDNAALTQHLADVRLDVNILQVLVCVCVEEPEGRVQTNGHPDAVSIPRQLPHLTLLTRMSVEWFLYMRNGTVNQ